MRIAMQRIPSLVLPDRLPSDAAIRSCNDNPSLAYTPELWEFEYNINRYLERVEEGELIQRYKDILKNLGCLSTTDRHIIPRQSGQSSWYWFQKEHQTRLELHLRGIELPETPLNEVICMPPGAALVRPSHPNAGHIIFRYCANEHALSLVNEGKLRVYAASKYEELEGDLAREDDELNKGTFTSGNRITVTTQDGHEIPVLGNLKRTVGAPNYYTYCTACDWDPCLQDELGGACVIIKNVNKFSTRINKAANTVLDGWYFYHNPIEYYDPYCVSPNARLTAATHKDFRFAYQREYRFIWMHTEGVDAAGHLELELGCLADIAELS